MKQQEVNFKCHNCEHDIQYEQAQCLGCEETLEWRFIVNLDFEDKYMERYTVYI